MKKTFKNNRKGLSTVFGSVLFLILISLVVSTLLISFYRYNDAIQVATNIEEERSREKIALTNLELSPQGIITGVSVQNLGSLTIQIRAFYVNGRFICDPSDSTINPTGTYIGGQDALLVRVSPVVYDPISYITVATSRGMKAISQESYLINTTGVIGNPLKTYYGPLRLNFSTFFYRETDNIGSPIGPWQPGAHIPTSVVYCAWNITVTNIDTRDITLNQYSSLTLVTNQGGGQFPWYIYRPGQFIGVNETISLVYNWQKPYPNNDASGFQGFSSATSKVFLTFFGKFSDGGTYAQTIPFEGVIRT